MFGLLRRKQLYMPRECCDTCKRGLNKGDQVMRIHGVWVHAQASCVWATAKKYGPSRNISAETYKPPKMITLEQQAIRQFLSRPAPHNEACGCLGAQALPGQPRCDGANWMDIKRYPACPCAMSYFEVVEDQFYKINTHRSPDGITHTATLYGPVGGPYLYDEYGRTPAQVEALTPKEDVASKLRKTEEKPVDDPFDFFKKN